MGVAYLAGHPQLFWLEESSKACIRINRSSVPSWPPTVLLLLGLFLPLVSILSGTSVILLSPQANRNRENHHHQPLPDTRCCWRPKWASRSSHPGKQSNKFTLIRKYQTHYQVYLSLDREQKSLHWKRYRTGINLIKMCILFKPVFLSVMPRQQRGRRGGKDR